MSRVETKKPGINRDIHSKALTPSAKNPEYRDYLERKAMSGRIDALESKLDAILDLLKKGNS